MLSNLNLNLDLDLKRSLVLREAPSLLRKDLGSNQITKTNMFIVYSGSQSSPLQKLFLKSGGWRAELRDAAMDPPLQSAQ